ncbi:MAG: GyrI-like domain-containing protein [Candidatus Methanofastidiosia archaeon]
MVNRSKDEPVFKTLNDSVEDIAFILSSLANKKRLQLLTSLLTRPRTFGELRKITGLGKTALAHHLRLLVKTGFLDYTGRGHYELSFDGREFLNAIGTTYVSSRRRRELKAAKRANYIQKIHTKEVKTMKEFKVRIVELEPMRVASVRAISETPEREAWKKMRKWAEPRGFLEDIKKHPVFGFNNPDPSPDRKEYGYEFWIKVEPDIESEGEINVKDFEGGLYAVTTCNLKEELESEFFKEKGYLESWQKITDWVKYSKYKFSNRQWLEKAHDPGASEEELILELYCPIEK